MFYYNLHCFLLFCSDSDPLSRVIKVKSDGNLVLHGGFSFNSNFTSLFCRLFLIYNEYVLIFKLYHLLHCAECVSSERGCTWDKVKFM